MAEIPDDPGRYVDETQSRSSARWDAEVAASRAAYERYLKLRLGQDVGPPPALKKLARRKLAGRTHLIIGDSHADPDHPNHRYDWLGRFIVDHQPEVIVDIGDWWTMGSLSSYDARGSKSYEGKRYWKDIEAGIDAQERVRWQMDEYNRGAKKPYRPEMVRTLGNHEHRIDRMLDQEPMLQGVLSTDDLLSREFGWREVPFLEPIVIDRIVYQHYFTTGVMGRATSGEHPAHTLLRKQFHSCVQGHAHTFDYSERHDATGRACFGLLAGCFFLHDEPWAPRPTGRMWRRGLCLLRNAADGYGDFEWWGMDRIRDRYA